MMQLIVSSVFSSVFDSHSICEPPRHKRLELLVLFGQLDVPHTLQRIQGPQDAELVRTRRLESFIQCADRLLTADPIG
jgi:hypothetical protein